VVGRCTVHGPSSYRHPSHRLADAVAEAVSGPWKLLSPERHHFFVVHSKPLWPKVATTSIRKYPELTLSVSYVGTDAMAVSCAT
jgi:hypothetical protein